MWQVFKCLRRSEEGTGSPGAGITGCCEPQTQVLGIELRSSARTAIALNHWTSSPASTHNFFETGSQCSPGWPWIHYADEDVLELLTFLLPPLKCWGSRYHQDCLFLCGAGMEPRASHMLGKHSTNWATPPALKYYFYKTKASHHTNLLLTKF